MDTKEYSNIFATSYESKIISKWEKELSSLWLLRTDMKELGQLEIELGEETGSVDHTRAAGKIKWRSWKEVNW